MHCFFLSYHKKEKKLFSTTPLIHTHILTTTSEDELQLLQIKTSNTYRQIYNFFFLLPKKRRRNEKTNDLKVKTIIHSDFLLPVTLIEFIASLITDFN